MNPSAIAPDRRRDPDLRAVFNEVLVRVEGFVDPSRTWGGGPLTMWVYRVVRESYPHLDAMQVQALVVATQRVYRARHAGGARARPAPPAAVLPVDEPA